MIMNDALLFIVSGLILSLVVISIIRYDFVTWWLWRRWTIYVPSYDVSHLFSDERADLFQYGLFDYDEKFVSPCTLNEVFVGEVHGKWTPRIQFASMIMPDEDEKCATNNPTP